MKRILIIILMIFSVSLFGENKALDALKSAREKTIKREKYKKDLALKLIKQEYLKKLEELMVKLTKKGDLDAALNVKAEIPVVKEEIEAIKSGN